MRHRTSSSDSESHRRNSAETVENIRTKPPHIYDKITRRLLQLGITLAITTFIGLIVRYAVQEFDPSVSTITVTTSRVNDRDVASLSVSRHFIERILEFVEESIAIVASILPLGFPLCSLFNKHFAKRRAHMNKLHIEDKRVLNAIPRYVIIGDGQACMVDNTDRFKPLVRDTVYQLIKARLKPKLIVEDSYDDARRLGIKIGLIRRDHHRLAVIKSVDLLRNITDSRGDIKQGKVRYLLSRMKIMSQSTPADKSLLVYLIKQCETQPNDHVVYLGYSFTDPEAMRIADCSMTFADCDDDDVKRQANVVMNSPHGSFTDVYLFVIICLLCSNITQSYALYQISAAVSCCIYRFLSITVFQEQLVSRSQFTLLVLIQQVFAIIALMTKWLSSLPQTPLRASPGGGMTSQKAEIPSVAISEAPAAGGDMRMHALRPDATLDSSTFSSDSDELTGDDNDYASRAPDKSTRHKSKSHVSPSSSSHFERKSPHARTHDGHTRKLHNGASNVSDSRRHLHLNGVDLDMSVINSQLVTSYKRTFHNTEIIDDVTYRLVKLHIAYQVLVMIIIMIFGNAMFQLNLANNRQHQTLAFNSLIMNNIFHLANCFNQFGEFNLRSGVRNHPFFACVLLLAVAVQVILTELNAFGLENLNPIQWFVCFVFALLSALIAPLTGQQQRGARVAPAGTHGANMTAPGANTVIHGYESSTLPRPATASSGGGGKSRSRTPSSARPIRHQRESTTQQHSHKSLSSLNGI